MPATLPTEALALAWAAQVGAVTWAEVVDWADGWMVRLDAPPAELLELSLSARRPNEAFTLVRRLARGGDSDAALPMLARRLLNVLEEGLPNSLFLAEHLRGLRFLSLPEVPDDVRLPEPPEEFMTAAVDLWYSLEPWNPEFTPDVAMEVKETLRRFL